MEASSRLADSSTCTCSALKSCCQWRMPPSKFPKVSFAGSLRAGQNAAAVVSLIQSARMNGHDPYAYLKDIRKPPANPP